MKLNAIYVPSPVTVVKDGVCLFETEPDALIEYSLPDGRGGPVDWDVIEFHWDAPGLAPDRRIYTKIGRTDPLFRVLYDNLDTEWLDERVREILADNGDVDLYAGAGA